MMRQIFSLIACFFCTMGYAQVDSVYYDQVDISLLTCKGGDEIYSTFGHTSIRVNDRRTKRDLVYNYGTFDTNTPYFVLKFLRGKLPYKLTVAPYDRFLYTYHYEKRSVIEQHLDLSPPEKEKLIQALQKNALPENATYAYDFFFDNCTTRAIDQISHALGGVNYDNSIKDITFRSMLKEHLTAIPWYAFGIDLIIGAKADRKTTRHDQHFLPIYLYDDVKDTKLLQHEHQVLDFEADEQRRKSNIPNYPLYLSILLLIFEIIIFFIKKNRFIVFYDNLWISIMSIAGLIMAFMWWGTEHQATKDNYNLLWANILFIPYLFISKNNRKILAYVIIFMCSITLLNVLFSILPQYFHPAFGVFALINILKLARQQRHTQQIV